MTKTLEEKLKFRVWLTVDDCIKIYRGCDLGDFVTVKAYLHPHVESAKEMNEFIQVAEVEDILKEMIPNPEIYLEHPHATNLRKHILKKMKGIK